MAGQAVNAVALAVTGEITNRVFSALIQRYGKDAATSEKLQRLEMLLIKINSAVEASEKLTIENSWLLKWRDKLKEAASRGQEILASFPQFTGNGDGNQQQQGKAASSSSSSDAAPAQATTDVGPLSFTKNSLSGMVRGIRNARNILFSSIGDDIVRLNTVLGNVEKLSPDIDLFIRLLHLEASSKVDQTHCSTSVSTKVHGGTTKKMRKRRNSGTHSNLSAEPSKFPPPPAMHPFHRQKGPHRQKMFYSPPFPPPAMHSFLKRDTNELSLHFDTTLNFVRFRKEHQSRPLQSRLEAAFAKISKAVEVADCHDLQDLEWLAYWAGILGDAKEQGWEVLDTIVNARDKEWSIVGCVQEDELRSFVHRLEGLARDVEYFEKLAHVCPEYHAL